MTRNQPPDGWLPPGVVWVQAKQVVPRNADPGHCEHFVAEFQDLLRSLQPDLVHAGPVQSCGYIAALSGFRPVLLMSWGSDILAATHRNEEWRCATEIALRGATGFFCDCNAVRALATGIVAFPDSRIVQFPWGIQRGRFAPAGPKPERAEFTSLPDAITFISTRSWEPMYDIDVLLEAFHQAHRVNRRLRLLLLGDGSEAGRIRDFIVTRKLAEVVRTPGQITGEELPRWFRAADAYISCAKSDGTSISLLEAMATGLAVIATDIPSNREWITPGENGWLAPVGCSEQFAERILRAANLSGGEREAISLRNQQIVSQRADWDKNFPALIEMYERLRRVATDGT